MTSITLNEDQEAVADGFVAFLSDPDEKYFVLQGYSGTGKSTMIKTLMDRLDNIIDAIRLLNPTWKRPDVHLTATTNKAADNFGRICKMDCTTIHSKLQLMLFKDPVSGNSELAPRRNAQKLYDSLLFIDEASYITPHLFKLILDMTVNTKIVFIGDPDQLLAPRSYNACVFEAGFRTGKLDKPMRQLVNGVPQANPITDLSHEFRKVLHGSPWPKPKMDGQYLVYLKEEDFEAEAKKEMSRANWQYSDSKILTFTNEAAIYYNKMIREFIHGDPSIQVGDYVENNHFISYGGKSIKTDELVLVTDIEEDSSEFGILGNWMTINYSARYFMPKNRKDKERRLKLARDTGEWGSIKEIEAWTDLRPVFGQTTNKAQGSTYKKVFINLNDISTCKFPNQIARMLYVGVSRATDQVIFTGDL